MKLLSIIFILIISSACSEDRPKESARLRIKKWSGDSEGFIMLNGDPIGTYEKSSSFPLLDSHPLRVGKNKLVFKPLEEGERIQDVEVVLVLGEEMSELKIIDNSCDFRIEKRFLIESHVGEISKLEDKDFVLFKKVTQAIMSDVQNEGVEEIGKFVKNSSELVNDVRTIFPKEKISALRVNDFAVLQGENVFLLYGKGDDEIVPLFEADIEKGKVKVLYVSFLKTSKERYLRLGDKYYALKK